MIKINTYIILMKGLSTPTKKDINSNLTHQPIYKITKRLTSYQFLLVIRANEGN